ncbi:MAG TPA: glycosyltransferase family 39 protein [Longimicrobiales bacterium]|nr:glycosyltransferase family 39 protein [Longimicrobiales bacterium]
MSKKAGRSEPRPRPAPARAGAAGGRPEPARGSWLRRTPPWAIALGLVALHLLLAAWVFDPTVFTGGDNASYLSLARSLVEGHGYRSTWEPGAPLHTQYPPVFPALIALGLLLGLKPWVGLKLIVLAFSAVAVAFSYLWLRRRGRPGLALAVGLILAASPGVLAQSHLELSDVPFWAFVMIALWAFERLGKGDRVRFAIAIVATVLAYFTRSAGLPLVVAAGGWLAWRRRWRQLAVFAAVLLPLAFLWWLRAHQAGGVNYARLFWYVNPYQPELGTIGPAGLIHRLFENERKYLGTHLPVLLAESTAGALAVLSYLVSILAVFGWIARIRRPRVAELFFPLYVGLIFVWPEVWSGERFLLPAIPLVLAYAGEALGWLAARVDRRAVVPVGAVATALLLLLGMPAVQADAATAAQCRGVYRAGQPLGCLDDAWQEFFGLAGWAKGALPPGAAVYSRKPGFFYVESGHPSLPVPMTRDPAEFFREARAQKVGYVLLDRLGGLTAYYFGPVLMARPEAFCLMRTAGEQGVALLAIRTEPAPPRPAPRSRDGISLESCPASYYAPSFSPGAR